MFGLRAAVFLFVAFAPLSAFAYIDPGTGATFVGSLAPLIVGFVSAVLAFGVKYFWHPIKAFFVNLFGRKKGSSE